MSCREGLGSGVCVIIKLIFFLIIFFSLSFQVFSTFKSVIKIKEMASKQYANGNYSYFT